MLHLEAGIPGEKVLTTSTCQPQMGMFCEGGSSVSTDVPEASPLSRIWWQDLLLEELGSRGGPRRGHITANVQNQ